MSLNYITDTLRALGITIRGIFQPTTTVQFPKEQRRKVERYRASFALTHDEHGEQNCIGCRICENICPSSVITVTTGPKRESPVTGKKRGYCDDFTLDLNACLVCELCVQVCPTDAIVMVRGTEQPAFSREDLFLTMDKLYANEKQREVTWATASRLKEMQDPSRSATPEGETAPSGEGS